MFLVVTWKILKGMNIFAIVGIIMDAEECDTHNSYSVISSDAKYFTMWSFSLWKKLIKLKVGFLIKYLVWHYTIVKKRGIYFKAFSNFDSGFLMDFLYFILIFSDLLLAGQLRGWSLNVCRLTVT